MKSLDSPKRGSHRFGPQVAERASWSRIAALAFEFPPFHAATLDPSWRRLAHEHFRRRTCGFRRAIEVE